MESSEIFKDNVYINKALKLYYDLQSGKESDKEYYDKEFVEHHIMGNIYKKKVEKVYHYIPIIDEYYNSAKSLATNPLIFNITWQYCQFIRWAEKVVFYKNTIDKKIYVDSAIDDLDCRLLVYTEDDVQIRFKLEKVLNPQYIPNTLSDVLSMGNKTPQYFKSMKIYVERLYGKKLVNHLTIIDDNNDFKDFSDSLLIESIEHKLFLAYEETVKEIFNLIYQNYKLDSY